MYQIPGKERHCEVKGKDTNTAFSSNEANNTKELDIFFQLCWESCFIGYCCITLPQNFFIFHMGNYLIFKYVDVLCYVICNCMLVAKKIHDSNTFQKIYNTGAYLQVLYN